jgi:hypothetical protein
LRAVPCHTNGIENFWALLKRSIKGTYVSVEPFHLFQYLDEQAYRFNTRKVGDGTRFEQMLGRVIGKRLTYASLMARPPHERSLPGAANGGRMSGDE